MRSLVPIPITCAICGQVFKAGRSDARTCSSRCKKALQRQLDRLGLDGWTARDVSGLHHVERLRHDPMVERSLKLQAMLRSAGYTKGDGVATAGIRLVSRLAKEHQLRDWTDTRSIEDYDALIHVLRVHLEADKGDSLKLKQRWPQGHYVRWLSMSGWKPGRVQWHSSIGEGILARADDDVVPVEDLCGVHLAVASSCRLSFPMVPPPELVRRA